MQPQTHPIRTHAALPPLALLLTLLGLAVLPLLAGAEPKLLLWGDTHLHTSNSFDAYLNRNMSADPATAYRFAKGLPVIHPYHRARVQIGTPLDFLVVADHAEYLGVIRYIIERGIPDEDLGVRDWFKAWMTERWLRGVIERDEGMSAFNSFLPDSQSVEEDAASPPNGGGIVGAEEMSRTVWQEAIEVADAYNEPGIFTTLIGWEWSSIPAGANLHRVVFTSGDASVASQFQPWSSIDSAYPEDLWAWLAETSAATGARRSRRRFSMFNCPTCSRNSLQEPSLKLTSTTIMSSASLMDRASSSASDRLATDFTSAPWVVRTASIDSREKGLSSTSSTRGLLPAKSRHAWGSSDRPAVSGISTLKHEPPLNRLSKSIAPPMSSTRRLTMARPRPEPP